MPQTKPYRYEGSRRWSANAEDDRCSDGSIRATGSTGPGDESERHPGAAYDSRCSYCWLNQSHTVAAHQRSVKNSGGRWGGSGAAEAL